ncbi:glycosyltransferase 61 family protein [Anabaena sp. AL09]|uniref:glycosyltransferase 61 family protein n=1 Tax=Anabaena sp. AL09 TaxID=1710891 RepID=UPI000A6A07B8|nr:glycosyltransferase 61 family protein [Anabaena sp. AL09]
MDITQLKHQADIYFKQGDFISAINFYEKCLELAPNLISNYWYLGLSWLLQGNEIECQSIWLSTFTNSELDLQDNDLIEFINLLKNKADEYLEQHNHQLAQTIYEAILEWDDNQPEIYYNLGHAVAMQGNLEAAIDYWQTVTEIQPDFVDAYLNQAYIWQKLENFVEAISCYENTLKFTNDYLIYYQLGLCYSRIKKWELAINCFSQSIQIKNNYAPAYSDLGIILIYAGNWEIGINYLRKALEIQPQFSEHLVNIGKAENLKLNNIHLTGINMIKSLLNISESENELYLNLGKIFSEINPELNKINFSAIVPISSPYEFYESTQEWIENNNFNKSHYVEIYPEIDIQLNHPKSLDNSIHFSFRFGKNIKLPSSFVVTIPQGRFWLSSDQTQSAIFTDESHFLADISPDFPILSPNHPDKNPRNHAIFSIEHLPPIHFREGNVAVLAGLTNNIYFHWMLDILPRWELLRKQNCDFDKIDYFVVDNSLPFQRETLNLLQIPENKQININQSHHIQASKLIVPSFPASVAWMPKWTCEFLKHHFLIPEYVKNTPSQQRIYITRNLAKSRRILNEDEILNLLQSYGFTVVTLESMSVLEQAALFSQAEIIISPHGSGLTNLVFCQPETKVIELFAPNYVYHCYWWLSNLIGLDYYYLLGETLPGWHFHHLIYPQDFSEDIVMNVRDLLKLIQICEEL